MTEYSMLWTTGTTGDGAASGYTQDQTTGLFHRTLINDLTNEGVLLNCLNDLDATANNDPAAPDVTIDSGAAWVYGFHYWQDAAQDLALTLPAVGDTGFRIVLRASYAPTRTCRLTVVMNTDGVAAIPALTQTADTTWDIPLYQGVVDTAGDIWTDATTLVAGVTDDRVYCHPNIEVETAMIADEAVTEAKHDPTTNAYGTYHPLYRNANNSLQADSGGDARGAGAVDLQQSRTAATQVASGDYSFVVGEDNTASGDHAAARGYGNNAPGDYAVAEGYITTASGQQAHSEGAGTTASGNQSHAEGGSTEAPGTCAHSGGQFSVAGRRAEFARASYRVAASGDVQYSDLHTFRVVTHSDANWYQLYIGGSVIGALLTVATDQVLTFDALITGTTQGCTKSFGFRIVGIVENDGGTTTLLASTVTTIYDADDVSFDARASADDVNDALLIEVQDSDAGGDVVRWSAVVRCSEVKFPA